MNQLQEKILNIIQTDLPITEYPWAVIAQQLHISESEITAEIQSLKNVNIIRRMGAIFDAARLGYSSTLIASQVPHDKIEQFVTTVNQLSGVSHNYGRDHLYNIWFTLTVPHANHTEKIITELKNKYQLPAIHSLPALKLYKIRVDFQFGQNAPAPRKNISTPANIPQAELNNQQKELVKQLQEDLPLTNRPYEQIGKKIGWPEKKVIAQILNWKQGGLIRRFGASIKHHEAGFTANGMIVFEIESDRLDQAGETLAKFHEVSHCYHRRAVADWPYNIFAMTHCRTADALNAVRDKMVAQIHPCRHDMLVTTAEYKKTNVKYFA